MSKVQKNDFVEIEFIGKVKDGDVFDTNIKKEAEKIGANIPEKPTIVCVGQGMLIKGFDEALEQKETEKKYTIELSQEKAFGPRKKELIRLIPKKIFLEQKIDPYPGLTLSLDNQLVRIISVSGGRVLVDFNNPVAGKDIEYEFTIKRKVEDIKEKVNAITEFLLKQPLEFEQKDKKIIFKAQEFYKPLVEQLNKQFKEIIGFEFDLEVKKN